LSYVKVGDSLKYERLGKTSIRVSKIGLGTWQFGSSYWGWGKELDEDGAIKIIRRAIELGINLIDTAEMYGNGKSEEVIGKALKGLDRDEVVLATKVLPYPWRLTPHQVIKALRGSMRRLGVSRIDLYQIHWPSPIFPLRGALRALEREVEEGRVGGIGVSNFSVEQLERARSYLSKVDLVSNQIEYNLLKRRAELDVIPHCLKEGISVIAYSPLAQGLLTGKYGPERGPKNVQRRIFLALSYRKIDWDLIRRLEERAREMGLTPAQLAIAWVIRREGILAIPGAKSIEQLESNFSASKVELDPSTEI